MVHRPQAGHRVVQPGRRRTQGIAGEGHGGRLVVGDPVLRSVAQTTGHDGGVFGKSEGGVAGRPAAAVLQGLRQVKVVQGNEGLDAVGEEGVHQAVVEVQAFPVHLPGALGQHPGPGDREAIGLQADLGHQVHVLGPAVIVVGSHVAGLAAPNPAGTVHEGIPHRRTAAVLVPSALNLIGGGGGAPEEARREMKSVVHGLALSHGVAGRRRTHGHCSTTGQGCKGAERRA